VPVLSPASSPHDAARERAILRELAHVLVREERAGVVHQLALERVTPWIGASFSSVFVREHDPEALTLAAAYRWPARFHDWIGALRVRVGSGPSGVAVGEGRLVEVPDLFVDPELAEWQDVARELGFRSILAAPLRASHGVLGAMTFYFASETTISDRERELIEVVADHVAIAAERAALTQELRRANAALVDTNAELERQYAAVVSARNARDRFLGAFAAELQAPLASSHAALSQLLDAAPPLDRTARETVSAVRTVTGRLAQVAADLVALAALKRGTIDVTAVDADPGVLLRDALTSARAGGVRASIRVIEPTVQLPPVRTDHAGVHAVLSRVLGHAVETAVDRRVEASFDVGRGWVAWRIAHDGPPLPAGAAERIFDEFHSVGGADSAVPPSAVGRLPLARRWAQRLGGDLRLDSGDDHAWVFTFILPLDANVEHRTFAVEE
jgi:K+-sensing histidine kinase KdpD